MKKILTLFTLLLAAHFYVGYYETRYAEDNRMVFFIKSQPTLQIEFVNLFASDSDDKPLGDLSRVEMNIIRDYCKYRLGIETWLQSQEELDACKPL